MRIVYDTYEAPFGPVRVVWDERGVVRVILTPEHWQRSIADFGDIPRDEHHCRESITQLDEYFHGKRRVFDLPLAMNGSPFSQRVWQELLKIPYGEVRSYGEIAAGVGRPGSARAVGQANRYNPLPIFVPCHRVIGKNGALTGYAGKGYIPIKAYLLELEKSQA